MTSKLKSSTKNREPRCKLTAENQVGKVYGSLQVVKFIPRKKKGKDNVTCSGPWVTCICLKCGSKKRRTFLLSPLRLHATKTCGCGRKPENRNKRGGKAQTTTFRNMVGSQSRGGEPTRSSKYQFIFNEVMLSGDSPLWHSPFMEQHLKDWHGTMPGHVKEEMCQLAEKLRDIIYSYINGKQPLLFTSQQQQDPLVKHLITMDMIKAVNQPAPVTPFQREVFLGLMEGMTQTELAKKLNINQSSITKCINGNSTYYRGTIEKHGGLLPKLRKILATDPEFMEIFKKYQLLKQQEDEYEND